MAPWGGFFAVCFLATFLELSFFDDETICFMHKPLFCIKGHVVALPAWGPGSPVPLAWPGFPGAAALLGWRGWVGRFRGVGLVGGAGVLLLGGWASVLSDDESTRRALYTYARCSGGWWRWPGGAGAGAAWLVVSWPRAMARDLHGCGGSDRQEYTR